MIEKCEKGSISWQLPLMWTKVLHQTHPLNHAEYVLYAFKQMLVGGMPEKLSLPDNIISREY